MKAGIETSQRFIDDLINIGYNDIPDEELEQGFQTIKSTLSSPILSVMLARHGAQEDLQKKLDTEDDDLNDFIAGVYANGDSIHDVSLTKRKVKTKFSNAMKKLKVRFLLLRRAFLLLLLPFAPVFNLLVNI